MISQAIAVVATLAALVSLAQWLRLAPDADPNHRIGYTAGAVAGALLVALLSPAPVGLGYKASLVFGLILTLLALTLHQSRLLPDAVGYAHLLWAYVVYAFGFASRTFWTWPSPWLLVPVAIAAAVYLYLRPRLRDLWETILFFAIILVLAAWQALNWAIQSPTSLNAWVGTGAIVLIVAAHSAQAITRFRGQPAWVAATAFPVLLIAQFLLAWSVWA